MEKKQFLEDNGQHFFFFPDEKPQVQEALWIPSRVKTKKTTTLHSLVKLLTTKGKQKVILKNNQDKKICYLQISKNKMESWLFNKNNGRQKNSKMIFSKSRKKITANLEFSNQ